MWKQKLKSGSVCYYERYKDPLTERVKTATITIKPTGRKSDDRNAESELQAKIERLTAISTDPASIRFGELCDRYDAYQRKEHKESTAISSKHHFNTIRKLIGDDTLVEKLTAPIVSDRLDCDSPVTYNERITRYMAMMRWAYASDLVKDIGYLDKLQKRKKPTPRVRNRQKYLEHSEIDILLDRMTEKKWKLLTEFMILSGLRIGEAIALEDADVDLDRREITVNKTLSTETRKISTTKTDTSDRIVYIQDELLDCCRHVRAYMRQEQLMYGYRTTHFFAGDDGDYVQYATYNKYLRENTERLIGRRLTTHALRHTHVALMAEAGVDLETISRRLGHADSKVTREIYFHVTQKMQENDRQKIKSVKMLDIC